MGKISLVIYAGTKEQYLLIDQLTQYFINTFNIDHEDCLIQILKVMQKTFGKRNISLIDFTNLPDKEQRDVFKEAIFALTDIYELEMDKLKIFRECINLYEDWKMDFGE